VAPSVAGGVSSELMSAHRGASSIRQHGRGLRAVALAAAALCGCGKVAAMQTAGADAAGADAAGGANSCDPCFLSDDFSAASLNTSRWAVAVGGGGSVVQHDGKVTLQLPAAANAYADLSSVMKFPVGSTFEASVTFTAGQGHDHKGYGFASGRVGSDCSHGETEAAMFRGQDDAAVLETETGGIATCNGTVQPYPAGTSILRVAWTSTQVVFQDNSTHYDPVTTNLPAGPLPVRITAYTYTSAPKSAVQIDVDYVIVSPPDTAQAAPAQLER
jgi:hypothetical protein